MARIEFSDTGRPIIYTDDNPKDIYVKKCKQCTFFKVFCEGMAGYPQKYNGAKLNQELSDEQLGLIEKNAPC